MPSFWHDLRIAARSLRRRPGFVAVVSLTLALGVGVNTAVFSVVHAVLLAPLPFHEANRLVTVTEVARTTNTDLVSPITFEDWQTRNSVFTGMASYRYWPNVTLENASGDPLPQNILQITSTVNIFAVLGIRPILGRELVDDGSALGAPEAVISYDLWQRRFAGNRNVIGRGIRVHGTLLTIVGVMPSVRAGMLIGWGDLWSPIRRYDMAQARATGYQARYLSVVARLKPGVTLDQARSRMSDLQRELAREATSVASGFDVRLDTVADTLVGGMRGVLLIVFCAAALAYLAACANIGNLMLARAIGREREVAMRLALGASRARVASTAIAEGAVLCTLGLALGVVCARVALALILSLRPDIPRFSGEGVAGGIDGTALLFAGAASVVALLLASAAPLLTLRHRSVQQALRDGGRTSTGGTRRRVRAAFAAAQVALASVLVVGAGLLALSVARLLRSDPGFRANGVVIAEFNNPRTWSAKSAERIAFMRTLIERVKQQPGITKAGALLYFPYHPKLWQSTISAEGASERPGERNVVYYNLFAGDYFGAMGIPLLAGRLPTDGEMWDQHHGVALINATLARTLFGTDAPLGRRFHTGEDTTWNTVIGVVGDVRQRRLDDVPRGEYYVPFSSMPMPFATLVARADSRSGAPAVSADASSRTVAEAMRAVEPALAASTVIPLERFLAASETERRVSMATLVMFAMLTAALAAVGLYGVMSYTVVERTPEIGVRMALGATPGEVIRLFTTRGLTTALGGIAVGMALAAGLWRALGALLYGVTWADGAVFIATPLALALVAIAAAAIPAARAARISPTEALRG